MVPLHVIAPFGRRIWLVLVLLSGLLHLGGPAVVRAVGDVGDTAEPASSTTLYLPVVMNRLVALSAYASQVVTLTNQERASAGCPPLSVSDRLTQAAQGHSQDMAVNDFFSHTGSNGSSTWQRISATGYSYSSAAENIAAGYSTPASVMAGWMGSPGHRANILNCNLREIGVGYYYQSPDTGSINYSHYWVQVFATPR